MLFRSYGNIMFFPLKALFFAAYSFLNDDEKTKIPHMLFSNVMMKVGTSECSINIGDLLVESTTFQKWYYNKFFQKDRIDYPFGSFISDIMEDLVPQATYKNKVGFDSRAPISMPIPEPNV